MTPERESELLAEIDRLRAEVAALRDDPEFDATDWAHPAWWRGHDYVSARFKEELDKARRERDDLKAKLDAELPAAWREDIQSLNECLERLGEEIKDVRKERDDAKADFESLEHDAAAVLRAWSPMADNETYLYSLCPTELRDAIRRLMDNGRPGWWEVK